MIGGLSVSVNPGIWIPTKRSKNDEEDAEEEEEQTIDEFQLMTIVLMSGGIFPPCPFLLRRIIVDRSLFDASGAFTQVEVEEFGIGEDGEIIIQPEVVIPWIGHVLCGGDRVQIGNVLGYIRYSTTIETRHLSICIPGQGGISVDG